MARSNPAAGQNGVARRRAGDALERGVARLACAVHRVVAPGRRFLRGGPHLHELQWRRDRKVSRIGVAHKPAGPAAAGDLVAAGQHDNAVSESRWPLWRRGRLEQATAQNVPPIPMLWGNARLLVGLITASGELSDARLLAAVRRLGDFYVNSADRLCADSRGRLSLQRYWRRWLHLLLLPGHRGSRHAL